MDKKLSKRLKKIFTKFKRFVGDGLIGWSSYKFVVNDWSKISDLDLAVRVLESSFFRDTLKPTEADVSKLDRVLVLAPHQDDETIGAGGTICKAADQGATIRVLYVTDGGQNWGRNTKGETIEVRREEAKHACEMVPAEVVELGISNLKPRPTIETVELLARQLGEFEPTSVFLPWILDAPPKHRMVNHLLWISLQRNMLGISFDVWGYQVHNTPVPNLYVDISQQMERKFKMLECFSSQNHRYKRYDLLSEGLSAWNARFADSKDVTHAEVFFNQPCAAWCEMVERFYKDRFDQVYRNDPQLGETMAELHRALIG